MGDDEPDGQGLPPAAPAYDFRTGRPLHGPDDPRSPPWRPEGDADELGIWAPDPDPRSAPAAAPDHPPGTNGGTGPVRPPTYPRPAHQQPSHQQPAHQQPAAYQQPAYQQPAYQQFGTYPVPSGAGGPTAEHAPLPPQRTSRAPVFVLLVGAVLAVGALAAVLYLTRSTDTPEVPTAATAAASSADPSQASSSTGSTGRSTSAATAARSAFARDVDAILNESSDGRRRVVAAVNGVRNDCEVVPAVAADSLTDVIANRQSVLARASDLSAPDAATEAVKAQLVQALSASLEANQGYQQWLDTALATYPDASPAAGCPGGQVARDADYDAATDASTRATSAKQQFVAAYNPIATQAGLPTWTSDAF